MQSHTVKQILVGGCQAPRTMLDGRDSMVNEIGESF